MRRATLALLVLLALTISLMFFGAIHYGRDFQVVTHHGIIVAKYQTPSSFHLIVNETGNVQDVEVDSVAYFTSSDVGGMYTWATDGSWKVDILLIAAGAMGSASAISFWWMYCYIEYPLPKEGSP